MFGEISMNLQLMSPQELDFGHYKIIHEKKQRRKPASNLIDAETLFI